MWNAGVRDEMDGVRTRRARDQREDVGGGEAAVVHKAATEKYDQGGWGFARKKQRA